MSKRTWEPFVFNSVPGLDPGFAFPGPEAYNQINWCGLRRTGLYISAFLDERTHE